MPGPQRTVVAGCEVRSESPLMLVDGQEFAHFYVTDPVGNRLEFLQPVR